MMTRSKKEILKEAEDEHDINDFNRILGLNILEIFIDIRTELWQIRTKLEKFLEGKKSEQKQSNL